MATPEVLDPPAAAASPPPAARRTSKPTPRRMTAEEYLAWESDPAREGERKSEYYHGEVIEMPGASLEHDEIVSNIARVVHAAVDPDGFKILTSDVKIGVAGGLFLYSDGAIVTRPPRVREGTDRVILNPLVVFEVLSPSTEARDKTDKYDGYTAIDSLRHYVMVDQDNRLVECHSLRDGHWDFDAVADEGVLKLEAVGLELPLSEIYRNVPLPAEEGGD